MGSITNFIENILNHKHQIAYYSSLIVSTAGVAKTISDVHGELWLGIVGAIAVDFGMLTFSEILGKSRKKGMRVMIWAAVSFMTLLSITANLYASLSNRIDRNAISSVLQSNEFIVTMAILFGAMFPIIVLALSGYKPKQAEKKVTEAELEALGIESGSKAPKKKKQESENQLTFGVEP